MFLPFLKTIFGLSWITFIVYYYYDHHRELILTSKEIYSAFPGLFILIAIIGACFYVYYRFIKSKQKNGHIKITPLRILLFAVFSLFLIFNYISFAKDTTVYQGGPLVQDEQGNSAILPENTDLSTIPSTQKVMFQKGELVPFTKLRLSGYPEEIKKLFIQPSFWQIQVNFFSHFLYCLLALFCLTGLGYILGSFLLDNLFHFKEEAPLSEKFLFSLGLGLGGIIFIVFLLGAAHLLAFPWLVGILSAIPLILYKRTASFFKLITTAKTFYNSKNLGISIFLISILTLIISFIVIMVLRPIPVGWDEIALYLNLPNLVSQAHRLISGFRPYNWELLISVGFIVFKNTTVALFISFYGLMLAVFAFYTLCRKFFTPLYSLLLVAIFSSLPMVIWQSSLDMKIDPALFFYGCLSFLAFLNFRQKNDKFYLYLCAIFIGIGIGIKITTLFLLFTFLVLLGYRYFKIPGAILFFSLNWAILALMKEIHLGETNLPPSFFKIVAIVAAIISIICGVLIIIRQQKKLYPKIIRLIVFIALVSLPLAPWMIKNGLETKRFNPNSLLYGKGENAYHIDYTALKLDPQKCQWTGRHEEMDRYFRLEKTLITRFLTMPWDLTMNTTVPGLYVNISFLFLAFIPGLIFFLFFKKDWRQWKWIFGFTIIYFSYWYFSGNGIIWYGMLGFIGLLLILGLLWKNAQEEKWTLNLFLSGLAGIWFITVISAVLSYTINDHLIAYLEGTITADQFTDGIFPGIRKATQIFIDDKSENNKVFYQIGTFSTYFLPENQKRAIIDHQLDIFVCLYQDKDQEKMVTILKSLGVKYLIFDHGIAGSERDEKGTLHQKKDLFIHFATKNSHLKMLFQQPNFTFYEIN